MLLCVMPSLTNSRTRPTLSEQEWGNEITTKETSTWATVIRNMNIFLCISCDRKPSLEIWYLIKIFYIIFATLKNHGKSMKIMHFPCVHIEIDPQNPLLSSFLITYGRPPPSSTNWGNWWICRDCKGSSEDL